MACRFRHVSFVALAVPLACSDPPATVGDSSSTGSEGGESSSTAQDPGSTSDESGTSSSSDGADSSSSDGADSSSSSGGESGEIEHTGVELVVGAVTPGGWVQYFYYGVDDTDGVVGPLQITEPGEVSWDALQLLPGRRAVYRGSRADGDEIVLGAVDNDDESVALDVPPVGDGRLGFPTPIPGADAVVFGEAQTGAIYRVDIDGDAPTTPVVVIDDVWSASTLAPSIDPTGRWLADHIDGLDPAALDLAVARLDVPDADGVVRLTEATAGAYGGNETFTSDGNGLFYVYADGMGATELRHVDLREDVPGDTTVVDSWIGQGAQYLFPTMTGAGLVYSVAVSGMWQSALRSTHVEDDGSVASPTVLLEDVQGTYWWMWTSADGRWMAFHVQTEGVERAYVLDVADPAAPTLHELDVGTPGVMVFSADSQWLYVGHDELAGGSISRYSLGDAPGARELVASNDGVVLIGEPRGLTSDGSKLLAGGYTDNAPAQLVYDVGGTLPAPPTVLNAPLAAGDWAQFGEVLSDDRHVAYIERNDVFGAQRMMLADLDHPGEAIEVMSNSRGWHEVRSR